MARLNNQMIVDALQTLAQAMGNQNRGEAARAAEYHDLDCFQRNNPPACNG